MLRKPAYLLAITGWIGLAPRPAHSEGEIAELLAELDALRRVNDISAVGLVLVDATPDAQHLDFIGGLGAISHAEGAPPVTPDTVFRLGSITKSFTALTALRLEAQGLLKLSDLLSDHLPDSLWHNPWAADAPVTLAQLLEHSAGFADITRAEFDIAEPLPLEQALTRFAASHVVRWRPGHFASYTNLGPGLVGLAMEKATGRAFETLVTEEVLRPIGMRDSGFDPSLVRATGYDRDGVTAIPYWHMVYRPFGGLNASLRDMHTFLRLQLGRGELGGQPFLAGSRMQRAERAETTLAARSGLAFGDGPGRYPWLRDGVVFYGHGGDADGYLSRYGYSHDLGRGYFLVINAFQGRTLAAMRERVEHLLTAGFTAPEPPPELAVGAEGFAWVSGEYRPQTARFGAPGEPGLLRLSDHGIDYQSGRGWTRLWATDLQSDRMLLRRANENRATVLVLRDRDGAVYFIDGRRNLRQATANARDKASQDNPAGRSAGMAPK